MLITFLTVISWIYVGFFLLSIISAIYMYSKLTRFEKSLATYEPRLVTYGLFFLSVAFLITKALT